MTVLEAAYFIMQIVAALAVVASLIFVGFQVRAYTREQEQARRFETFQIFNTIADFMSGPGNLSEVYAKAATDINNMTQPERIRFANMYTKCFNAYDLLIGMCQSGDISKDELARFEAYLLASFNSPMIRQWWEKGATREAIAPRVIERIDAYVTKANKEERAAAPLMTYDA